MRAALYGDEAGRRPPLREGQGGVRADPRRRGLGHEDDAATKPRSWRTRPSASRAAFPTSTMNFMTGWYGGEAAGGHVGFSPVAPLTGRDALTVRDLMRGLIEGQREPRLPRARCSRSTRAASSTSRWSSSTPPTSRRSAAPTTPASCSCARRPSTATASTAPTSTSWTSRPSSISFGDHAYRRFNETIKDAVDPNGILAPGKQGIWPASMRDGGGLRDVS